MKFNYRLVMQSGPTVGKIFELDKPELFIGREPSNDIVINDVEISRRHSRMFLQGGSYVIEDLGSTNGTSVNGGIISSPTVLHPGELILLGENISLLFELHPVMDDDTSKAAEGQSPAENLPQNNINQPHIPAQPVKRPDAPPVAAQQPIYPQQSTPSPQPAYRPRGQAFPPPPGAYQPPQQAYPPPQQPVYMQPEPELPLERKRFPTWLILAIIFIILLSCICLVILFVIDSNAAWCDVFGFLFNVINPGTCP